MNVVIKKPESSNFLEEKEVPHRIGYDG